MYLTTIRPTDLPPSPLKAIPALTLLIGVLC